MSNAKVPNEQAQPVAFMKNDLPGSADCAETDPQSLQIQQMFECLVLSAHNKNEGICHPGTHTHTPASVFHVKHKKLLCSSRHWCIPCVVCCPVLSIMH